MTLFPSQFVQFQVVVALIVLVMFSLNVLFVVDLLLNHHTRSKLHTHTHTHTHTLLIPMHTPVIFTVANSVSVVFSLRLMLFRHLLLHFFIFLSL